jgi:hypothetical protein
MGTNLNATLNSLMGHNGVVPQCDVGGAVITQTPDRIEAGLTFSIATYTDELYVIVRGVVRECKLWQFLDPLGPWVWITLLVAPFVVAKLIFVFDGLFSKTCAPLERMRCMLRI